MGLCKCPKKKVTNQFCFEHRVNVCEFCMVDDHPKCVVQSYLQWLNDSDYNPVCQLCQEELISAECIRLVCYDVFHKICLDDWAKKLPSNTAPAGYRCPVCASSIFPASNLVSPIADSLRKFLSSCEWTRAGLGMPLVRTSGNADTSDHLGKPESFEKLIGTHQNSIQLDRGIPDGHDPTIVSPSLSEEFSNVLGSSQHRNASSVVTGISQKQSDSSNIYIKSEDDTDDNKYKRRSAFEWFNRWLRTFHRPSSRHHQGVLGGRRRMGLLLAGITICTIVALLVYFARTGNNDDPMLDPFSNPNIRVQEE